MTEYQPPVAVSLRFPFAPEPVLVGLFNAPTSEPPLMQQLLLVFVVVHGPVKDRDRAAVERTTSWSNTRY